MEPSSVIIEPRYLKLVTVSVDHEGTVSIGGRTITNLHFVDDIDGLDKASTAYGMEISAEKTKLMTNNTSGINTEIKLNE